MNEGKRKEEAVTAKRRREQQEEEEEDDRWAGLPGSHNDLRAGTRKRREEE